MKTFLNICKYLHDLNRFTPENIKICLSLYFCIGGYHDIFIHIHVPSMIREDIKHSECIQHLPSDIFDGLSQDDKIEVQHYFEHSLYL